MDELERIDPEIYRLIKLEETYQVESVRFGQIEPFQNDVEVDRLTGQHHVRTDSHGSRFQALKHIRRSDRRNIGSHGVA